MLCWAAGIGAAGCLVSVAKSVMVRLRSAMRWRVPGAAAPGRDGIAVRPGLGRRTLGSGRRTDHAE